MKCEGREFETQLQLSVSDIAQKNNVESKKNYNQSSKKSD